MSNPAGRARLLAHSIDQGIDYDERSYPEFLAARISDACDHLGCAPEACRPFARNRNANLFRFDHAGKSYLLKVLVSKPAATLDREYANLVRLGEIAERSGAFRVPRPLVQFDGRSSYLMEFVEGQALDRWLCSGDIDSRLPVLRAVGHAVACIHQPDAASGAMLDAAALREDLGRLPWTPSDGERRILARALGRLEQARVEVARLYMDCDPVNVRVAADGGVIWLDPPERDVVDAVHWDLGMFLFGLRRLGWKRPGKARRLRRDGARMRGAFLEGYAGGGRRLDDETSRLLLAIAELVRMAQLWLWWLRPLAFRHKLAGVARAAYAFPLLQRARRERYAALAAALEDGEGTP